MRFAALDGWRGIAALAVCLYHLSVLGNFYDLRIVRNGGYFVEFFFVLSGFVLAHAYAASLRERESAAVFAVRRVGRLWPLHLFSLGLLIACEVAKWGALHYAGLHAGATAFARETGLDALLANALLLHGLGIFSAPTWNVPSWSISTELSTNLLFAWVCYSARDRLVPVALALTLAAGAAAAVILHLPGATVLRAAFPICVCDFFLGVLAYAAFRYLLDGRLDRARVPWAAIEVASLALICVAFEVGWLRDTVFVLPLLFASAIVVFAAEAGPVSKVLRTRPFQHLGKISYSVYMMHFVILTVINGGSRALGQLLHQKLRIEVQTPGAVVDMLVVGPLWAGDLVALGYVVVVLGVATWTYHAVERPWQRRFDGWAARIRGARRPSHARRVAGPMRYARDQGGRPTEDAHLYP